MSRPRDVEPIFGLLRSGYDVEQGALTVLRASLPIWLYQVEKQQGLDEGTLPQPPDPTESYLGGVDFESYDRDKTPAVMVVVKPEGDADLSNDAGYVQQYTVRVGAVVFGETEDDVRRTAWLYGAAIQGVMTAYGDLDGVAIRTRMRTGADIELETPDNYTTLTVSVVFDTWVDHVGADDAGPGVFPPQSSFAYPGKPDGDWDPWPSIGEANVTVTAEPLNEH